MKDDRGDLDLTKIIEDLKTELQFSGEYDNFDALITISGGAGGVDAQDWASMILRMYLRWADKRKFNADLLTTSPGEEAGIKSALIRIKGEKLYVDRKTIVFKYRA